MSLFEILQAPKTNESVLKKYIYGGWGSNICFLVFYGIEIVILQANNRSKQVVEVLVCSDLLKV